MIGHTTSDRQMADAEQVLDSLVDEVTERLHAGQDVNIDDYARAHPDYADRLRRLFPTLQAMADIGHSIGGKETAMAAEHSTPRALGDFQIMRELGRGGMGVVYEAEQISIGRHVALKVLPFAALLDKRQLNRFKNEARAAGTLEHPHIVSVYSVGTDRGVHYYAMQLIEGQSVAELLGELRRAQGLATSSLEAGAVPATKPALQGAGASSTDAAQTGPESLKKESRASASTDTQRDLQAAKSTLPDFDTQEYFRSVAELGIQAARAIDHAHQHGIVHRDVKPGNLLIDIDGKLWLTDFGLAHIESDKSLTMTGDMVGTLRYMSPEQTQAPRAVIDYRTDIYSLGATLYELLTLQPACRGASRQELLKEIAEDEPISPGRISTIVPRDLVTIVQKSMEKRPEDRYGTAQEMADDLTRFLQDRPIHAKPPSPLARVVKYARRHKGLVSAAALLLILGSIGLAASNVMLSRERDQKDAALQAAQRMAQREKEIAAEATLQQERAEANLIRALEAVDQLLTSLADKRMLDAPHVEPLRRQMAQEALELCDALLEGNPEDPRVARRFALAHLQQGKVYRVLGEYQAAEKALRISSRQLAQLVRQAEDAPTREQHEASLIQSHLALGSLLYEVGHYEESTDVLREAIELGQRLVAAHPQPLPHQPPLARSHNQLGLVHKSLRQREEALAAYREAIRIWQQLMQVHPDEADYCVALARSYVNLGNVQQEPRASYEEAIRLTRQVLDSDPWSVLAKDTLAKAHMQLATWNKQQGHLAEALEGYRDGTQIFESLAQQHPLQPRYRAYLGGAYCNQGGLYVRLRKQDEALSSYTRAVETLESVLPQLKLDVTAQEFVVTAQMSLANALRRLNRDDEAVEVYSAAIEVLVQLAQTRPANYQQKLAELHYGKALAMEDSATAGKEAILEQWHAVLSARRQLIEDCPDNPAHVIRLAHDTLCMAGCYVWDSPERTAAVQDALTLLRSMPESTRQRADWRETMARALSSLGGIANRREGLQMLEHLVKEDGGTLAQRQYLADDLKCLANLLRQLGRLDEAEPLLRKAIRLREQLVANTSGVQELHSGTLPVPSHNMEQLANCHACLGFLFKQAGRPAECLEAYRQAVAVQTEVVRRWPSAWEFYKLLVYYQDVCDLPCPDEQLDERLQWQRDWLAAYEEFEGDFPNELNPHNLCASKPYWGSMIAWVLATCPDPRLRHADRAVQFAQNALNHAPEEGQFWITLGAAQYRTGDWEESINTLETAMELRSGGDSFDFFLLAMAHWQLGQPDEARRWYDRGVEWMEEHKPNDKELKRFRAEAAALMGLEATPS